MHNSFKEIWRCGALGLTALLVCLSTSAHAAVNCGFPSNTKCLISTPCSEANFDYALANVVDLDGSGSGTGSIIFDCGLTTLSITTTKTISTKDISIAGEGITLDGGGMHQVFVVNFRLLILQNVNIINGKGANVFGCPFGDSMRWRGPEQRGAGGDSRHVLR